MKEFIKWCKEQTEESVGQEFNHLCWQLEMLYTKFEKETTATKFYMWRNYISDSEEGIDDIIFNELSKHNKYPNDAYVHEAWESDGEEVELTAKELWKLLNEGYKMEVEL